MPVYLVAPPIGLGFIAIVVLWLLFSWYTSKLHVSSRARPHAPPVANPLRDGDAPRASTLPPFAPAPLTRNNSTYAVAAIFVGIAVLAVFAIIGAVRGPTKMAAPTKVAAAPVPYTYTLYARGPDIGDPRRYIASFDVMRTEDGPAALKRCVVLIVKLNGGRDHYWCEKETRR